MNQAIAGIILAGGGSTRLGRPKQLLDWFGESVTNHVIRVALDAKLSPVVLVTGSKHEEVIEDVIFRKKIRIAHNNNWEKGQSTSLISGINRLESLETPFVILLCDQPQVDKSNITQLIQKYKETKCEIVATEVNGKIVPPILFDPICISELLALTGDQGGRSIIRKMKTVTIKNDDERLLLDIDTEKDYILLKRLYEKCV
jgi:molybdenum cofactor cytidylyltransferase